MRLTELLGAHVVDRAGTDLGRVQDVRAVEEALPPRPGLRPRLRVEGVVAGNGAFGVRLGYERFGMKGPWPLAALFRRVERKAVFIEWGQVDRLDDYVLHLKVRADEVRTLSEELRSTG